MRHLIPVALFAMAVVGCGDGREAAQTTSSATQAEAAAPPVEPAAAKVPTAADLATLSSKELWEPEEVFDVFKDALPARDRVPPADKS